MTRDVVYWARGGGHGHAVRGLALLSRLGSGILVAPERIRPWAERLGVRLEVPPRDPAEIGESPLLLVDTFPVGPEGELRALLEGSASPPAWLVARRMKPGALLAARRIVEARYERIVWCESPPAHCLDIAVRHDCVGPILLPPPEAFPRETIRRSLGISPDAPLILAVGAGPVEYQERLVRLLAKVAERVGAELRFASAELPPGPIVLNSFPVVALFPAADLVVASGGYQIVHEIVRAEAPAIFLPQRRRFDDQHERVAGWPVPSGPDDLERMVREALERREPRERSDDRPDGARLLAELVERRVKSSVLAEEKVAPGA